MTGDRMLHLVAARPALRTRRLITAGLTCILASAFASTLWAAADSYDAALARQHPIAIGKLSIIADNASRYLTQAVELRGQVMGVMRGEIASTVLLKLSSGETAHLLARPEQKLVATGEGAQVVAQLAELPGDRLVFNLLAIKPETPQQTEAQPQPKAGTLTPDEVYAQFAREQLAKARKQPAATARQPRYALPSRGGEPPPPEDRILAAYEGAIAYFNPRLRETARCEIARYIIDFSRRNGVDARLVMAVVAAESNFNAWATSRTGAMGLGQLMPATARGLGVRNAYDARENLWGAIRLIRGHLENTEGDLALALACYNAGSGAVRRYGGVPPYRETRNYIRRVVTLYLQLAPEMAG